VRIESFLSLCDIYGRLEGVQCLHDRVCGLMHLVQEGSGFSLLFLILDRRGIFTASAVISK
jgi:hypothetical protein